MGEYNIGIIDVKYPKICDDQSFLTNLSLSIGKHSYNLSVIRIYKNEIHNIISTTGVEKDTEKNCLVNFVINNFNNKIEQGFVKTNDYTIKFYNKNEIDKMYYSLIDENNKHISGYINSFHKFDVDFQVKIIDRTRSKL